MRRRDWTGKKRIKAAACTVIFRVNDLPECSRKLETRINLRLDLMAKGCRESESREGLGEGGRGGDGGVGGNAGGNGKDVAGTEEVDGEAGRMLSRVGAMPFIWRLT